MIEPYASFDQQELKILPALSFYRKKKKVQLLSLVLFIPVKLLTLPIGKRQKEINPACKPAALLC